ncbi:MAG: hypothetical protein LQ350_005117 [Teloschistes chrysophthalmus]|nr:MAG: hypothetical protein LQ350_005117 [Niorma chrysophthalma]
MDLRENPGNERVAETNGTYNNERISDEEKDLKAVQTERSQASQEPLGDETNSDVKYRTMAWCGIILILGLGALATYTGYVIGQFKLAYPRVHNMADAGEILLGPIGREVFGIAQMLFIVFIMGSHILTFTIMMNTITGHATCSIVFGIVGLIISLICTLPRTLHNVSHMAIVSFISIVAAVLITMIGVGANNPGRIVVQTSVHTAFPKAFLATTNIVFAYAGHVAFFSFISEMKHPETYMKALFLLQGADVSMYLIVAVVTYRYAGPGLSSPALGSTTGILPKLAYGIAIPTIVIAGVINGHVAAKYCYVRLFRGTNKMSQRTWGSYGRWGIIVLLLWTAAWIIAEAIPVFNDLLGLISALFASWFTYGLSGVFWLFLNYGKYRESRKQMALTALNVFIFLVGLIICVLGLYASGVSIAADAKSSSGSFSCADNSKEG